MSRFEPCSLLKVFLQCLLHFFPVLSSRKSVLKRSQIFGLVLAQLSSCSFLKELRKQVTHTFLTANLDNFSNKILCMYFLWFPHIMNAYCSLQGQAGLTKVGCLAICHFHLVMYILRHYFSFFMSSIFLAAYLHSAQPLPTMVAFENFCPKSISDKSQFQVQGVPHLRENH